MELILFLILLAASDTTPPVIQLRLDPPPRNGWVPVGTRVSFECTDESAVITCGQSWPLMISGRQPVTATALDAAGNEATASFMVDIDGYGPTIELEPVNGKENYARVRSTKFELRGRIGDTESGIDYVECGIADGPKSRGHLAGNEFTCPVTLLGRSVPTVIDFRAYDRVGNESHRLITITADLVPPYIYVEQPSENMRITSAPTTEVLGHVQADDLHVIRVNGLPVTVATNNSFRATVKLQEGENVIGVVAIDDLGNEVIERFIVRRVPRGEVPLVVWIDQYKFTTGGLTLRAKIAEPRCGRFGDWKIFDGWGNENPPGVFFASQPECRNETECVALVCYARRQELQAGVSFFEDEEQNCFDE